MKTIALKVDVTTLHGAREGVPRLCELFTTHGVKATFLFNVGADYTGRNLGTILRRRLSRRDCQPVLREQYSWASLLYGTLLPAPDISRRADDILRQVEAAGFEVGIRSADDYSWLKHVASADAKWTQDKLSQAFERFAKVLGHEAQTHGAPGCKMNRTAFRLLARKGVSYASDTVGEGPFLPIVEGEPITCVQLPATLSRLDDLAAESGGDLDVAVATLLADTEQEKPYGHVFSLQADLEGLAWQPTLVRLLEGWLAQGYRLITLADLYASLNVASLPYHAVELQADSSRFSPSTQGQLYPG